MLLLSVLFALFRFLEVGVQFGVQIEPKIMEAFVIIVLSIAFHVAYLY